MVNEHLLHLPTMQLSHCSVSLLPRIQKPSLLESLALNVRTGEESGVAPVNTMTDLRLMGRVKVIRGAERVV